MGGLILMLEQIKGNLKYLNNIKELTVLNFKYVEKNLKSKIYSSMLSRYFVLDTLRTV